MQRRIDAKRLAVLETAAFLLTAGGQAALRNIYEMAGRTLVAGIFGEANGSIWEHMKIVFFSYVFFSLLEYFASGVSGKRFFCAKSAGCLFLFLAVPLYLYACAFAAGRIGAVPDVAGIFVLTALAFLLSYRLILSRRAVEKRFVLWLFCLCVLLVLFLTLTVFAFPAKIFTDPKTGDYGLYKHPFTVSGNTDYT